MRSLHSSLILFSYLILLIPFNSRQAEKKEEGDQISQVHSANDGSKRNEVDENWLRHYNQVFYGHELDGLDLKLRSELSKLVRELERLHAQSFQISNPELKDKGSKVFELIKLSHVFPSSCTGSMFTILDSLAKEYSQEGGYSVIISDYIRYFRNKFWLQCEQSFIEGQRANVGRLVYNDEIEAFSIVDQILTVLDDSKFEKSNSKQLSQLNLAATIDTDTLLQAVINYVETKLDNVSSPLDLKSKIDELFVDTISPVCGSIRYRFIGKAKMGEIINEREDLKKRLDSTSIKWLIAEKVCREILVKLLFLRDKTVQKLILPPSRV